jgi:hypothetical protein
MHHFCRTALVAAGRHRLEIDTLLDRVAAWPKVREAMKAEELLQ